MKVIKLTESDLVRIVKRVISEQLGGLLNMPETGQDVVGTYKSTDTIGNCKTNKSSYDLILEVFGKLRGISGQPNQADKTIQSWVDRISKSMSGLGVTDDLTKVLSEIKTQQQMGSVLNAYNKRFGRTLIQDLGGEHTISWNTIWKIVKKFTTGMKIQTCKEYKPSEQLSA